MLSCFAHSFLQVRSLVICSSNKSRWDKIKWKRRLWPSIDRCRAALFLYWKEGCAFARRCSTFCYLLHHLIDLGVVPEVEWYWSFVHLVGLIWNSLNHKQGFHFQADTHWYPAKYMFKSSHHPSSTNPFPSVVYNNLHIPQFAHITSNPLLPDTRW